MTQGIERRAFLAGAAAAAAIGAGEAEAQHNVPNSTGTEAAKTKAPPNATDCHMHTYDPGRFTMPEIGRAAPSNARVEEYRLLQKRIGTSRVVIVQPRNYATTNEVTLYAVQQLQAARGIVVVNPSVSDTDLKRFNDGGIRGIRFSLADSKTRAVTPDMIEPLAKRIADYGWHIQFNVDGPIIMEIEPILRRLPTPMVFDHLAHPGDAGIDDPSHKVVRDLLDKGKAWVKLSGAYSNTKVGPPYPDATKIAQAFVKAAPERLVWGSDWPHPGEPVHKPDDALLFDLLSEWAPDEKVRNRILVDNPAALYGFA